MVLGTGGTVLPVPAGQYRSNLNNDAPRVYSTIRSFKSYRMWVWTKRIQSVKSDWSSRCSVQALSVIDKRVTPLGKTPTHVRRGISNTTRSFVCQLCQLHIRYLIHLPYTLVYYILAMKMGCFPPIISENTFHWYIVRIPRHTVGHKGSNLNAKAMGSSTPDGNRWHSMARNPWSHAFIDNGSFLS
ncbi:hypothetical protein T10_4344 [Trichinella papuae]|uniref:Uncharacterized protein n=1 Tax=Trichinella papuae TaxID=268474 RepID=A0A0V1N8W9_9BILA|nr:hypothetical protein T10_4344 [Trichinella papuae]